MIEGRVFELAGITWYGMEPPMASRIVKSDREVSQSRSNYAMKALCRTDFFFSVQRNSRRSYVKQKVDSNAALN